ncbi:hypothetical protein WJX72_002311 [[Myrmecia] bisecta]|uniref:Uncharacterized protein n=1 Tax=[Myrmecia] bisecta TaxID=41462 RepID=A0AAW1Q4B3_9CHLO
MLSPGRADCSVAEPPPDVCEFAERAWGMPAWELDKPGFVELPVPFGRFGPQIYVRACYLALWAWIKEQQNQPGSPFRGCVITGNPGIGKSYFLAFVLTMLLQQMQRVLWQAQFTAKEQYWWLFEDGGVTELTPTDARRVLQRGGVYYLSDGTNPAIDGNMKPILALVAHLPDAAAYKQVMRQVEGVQASPVVLPPWETVDELLNLQPLHPSISREQVEERFRKRGGVPRTVFERSKGVLNPLRGDLRSALGDLQFGALLHANDAIDGFSAQASHQLIMLNVPKWREGDWETYEVNITSPWIAELIWDRSIKQAGAFANTFALMTNDITKGFNAFVGDLWEAAWHKVPAALPDKMYTIRELLPKAPVKRGPKPAGYKPPAQTPVQDIDSKRCFHFFANQFATFAALDYIPNLDLEPNMYIRPLWGNLPGVASFRLKGELFQLTRSSSKPAMTDALLKVLAMLPDNAVPELYIVVPNRTIFDAWVVSITLPTWEGAAQATRDFVLERNAKDKVVRASWRCLETDPAQSAGTMSQPALEQSVAQAAQTEFVKGAAAYNLKIAWEAAASGVAEHDVVAYLLEAGADPLVVDWRKQPLLQCVRDTSGVEGGVAAVDAALQAASAADWPLGVAAEVCKQLKTQRLLEEAVAAHEALKRGDRVSSGCGQCGRLGRDLGLRGAEWRQLAVQLGGIPLMLQRLDEDVMVNDMSQELMAQVAGGDLQRLPRSLLTLDALLKMLQEGLFTGKPPHTRPINVAAAEQFLKAGGFPSVRAQADPQSGLMEGLNALGCIPYMWSGTHHAPLVQNAALLLAKLLYEEHHHHTAPKPDTASSSKRRQKQKQQAGSGSVSGSSSSTPLRDAFWRISSLHCFMEGTPAALKNWTDLATGQRVDVCPRQGARAGALQLLLTLSLDKTSFSLVMGKSNPGNPQKHIRRPSSRVALDLGSLPSIIKNVNNNLSQGAAVLDSFILALVDDGGDHSSRALAVHFLCLAAEHDSTFLPATFSRHIRHMAASELLSLRQLAERIINTGLSSDIPAAAPGDLLHISMTNNSKNAARLLLELATSCAAILPVLRETRGFIKAFVDEQSGEVARDLAKVLALIGA